MRILPQTLLAGLLLAAPLPALAMEVVQLDLPAKDLIFNPHDGYLYASVPGSVPSRGNTITRIDPGSGALVASVNVGSEPGKLALSDDGSFLYVALDGAAAVRRVDLTTFTAGLQFALGSDPFTGVWYAEDIAVQPGNRDVVAISLRNSGFSPRHEGVAIYDNGVIRAIKTAEHTGSNRIEFSSDPTRLYGYNNESTEFGFRRMVVDEQGVSVIDVASNLISGFGLEIYYDQGRIYTSYGLVVDPEARVLLGEFSFPGFDFARTAAPDGDRAYFVTGEGFLQLHEFDTATFTPVLRQGITGVQGLPSSLVRWGQEGLAFCTRTSFYGEPLRVVILRRIHEPPTSDLAVSQTDSQDPVAPGSLLEYRVTVRNLGPSTASNVTLRDTRPANSVYQYVYSTRGSCYDSSGTVVCNFGEMSDSTITTTIGVTLSGVGTHENRAQVFSSTLDPNGGNNTSIETTEARTPPVADVFLNLADAPTVASVGQPLTYTIWVGNHGPEDATDVSFQPVFYATGPVSGFSVTSPRGTCGTDTIFSSCQLGTIAPGDSFQVQVHGTPLGEGYIQLYASVSSSRPDTNYSNNALLATTVVRPSATALLQQLITFIFSQGFKNGVENGLVTPLRRAQDALASNDSSRACSELQIFRQRVAQRSGRGLTVAMAFQLIQAGDSIAEVLQCGSAASASGNEASAETAVTNSEPTFAVGRRSLRFALPSAGHVRLDLLDIQGRVVQRLLDEPRSAGAHELVWDPRGPETAGLKSGLYFLRLVAAGRSLTGRTLVLH